MDSIADNLIENRSELELMILEKTKKQLVMCTIL